jgi:hypothetical protein
MLITALALKDKFPVQKYCSDYAKLALSTRPGWTQFGESFFEHRSGLGFEIEKNQSLRQVVKSVVEIEIRTAVLGRPDTESLIVIALSEVDKYFSRSRA